MANFKQAIKWLKDGKKVRRPNWKKDSHWIFGRDQTILFHGITNAHIHLNQIEADDWEIYKGPKDWTCSKCGKTYKTYAVILDDNPLSISCELEVREQYYNQKLKKGLCEKCSKKIRK